MGRGDEISFTNMGIVAETVLAQGVSAWWSVAPQGLVLETVKLTIGKAIYQIFAVITENILLNNIAVHETQCIFTCRQC